MKVKSLVTFARIDEKGIAHSHVRDREYDMSEADAKYYIAKGFVEEVKEEEKTKSKKKKSEEK